MKELALLLAKLADVVESLDRNMGGCDGQPYVYANWRENLKQIAAEARALAAKPGAES